MLQADEVDAVFLDIQMPGLTGLDAGPGAAPASSPPPPVVFVTAHEEHAVDAFELRAVDYVLKPVRAERLAEAVRRRVLEAGRAAADGRRRADPGRARRRHPLRPPLRDHATSRRRATTRGCTPPTSSHLVRMPLATLERASGPAGFVRIHRSHAGRARPRRGGAHGRRPLHRASSATPSSPVSRRHTRELRDGCCTAGR